MPEEIETSVHWSVYQTPEGWEVRDRSGEAVATAKDYGDALAVLSSRLAVAPEADAETGLLPETWRQGEGICFSAPTGDGRDFTDCVWSWRDPEVSLLPLMLQTENPDFGGHVGAILAGFISELSQADGTVSARGRFYDSEEGQQARDLLLGGRRFGVSVDASSADGEWVCDEMDEDGWCVSERLIFTAYEIDGLTMTPFPAFARASIVLEGTEVVASAPPVRPPQGWFAEPEPEAGDERLVEQRGGALACPLTITDEGQVYGHPAYWGQAHVGYPGQNINPPSSARSYSDFMVGEVVCADGSRVSTGTLTAGCDHALAKLRAPEARDHYAHSGMAWADVRVVDGAFGPWVCGALRPDVTEEQLRVLRASALSGDWRRLGGALEMIAVLAVNTPGFPIAREMLAASGLVDMPDASMPRGRIAGGESEALVAANVVMRCADCAKRKKQAYPWSGSISSTTGGSFVYTSSNSTNGTKVTTVFDQLTEELAAVRSDLAKVERRTRHLIPEAARFAARRDT